MKIAVTGASGFIGQYVCQAILNQGFEVLKVGRIKADENDKTTQNQCQYLQIDYANPSPAHINQLVDCDALIHLAWGGLPNYHSNHHFEVELPLHYRFLKQLINHGLSSLLVAGTCFEYGMQTGELSEDTTANPSNPYGYAKHALHQQLVFLQNEHSYALQWARLFYTYGQGQSPNSLYTQLHQAIAQNDARFPMSPGEQLRDFLPVEQLAHLLVQLASTQKNLGTVNVCSGQPIRVRTLVEQWCHAQQSEIQLDLGVYPYSTFEPMAFWGNVNKCMRILTDSHHG